MRNPIVLMAFVFLVGIPALTQTGETVKTQDGLLVATLPSGWMQTKGKSYLMVQNADNNAYAMLGADDRRDYYGLNLEKYSFDRTYQILKDLTFISVSGPKRLTISGNQAIQYELNGVSGALKVSYIITSIEAPNTFQSVVTWTTSSYLEKVRKELEMIPQLVKEGSIK